MVEGYNLSKVLKEDFTKEVTFEPIPEGSERVNHVQI